MENTSTSLSTRKRSIGVTIFAILFLCGPLWILFQFVNDVRHWGLIKSLPVYLLPFVFSIVFITLATGLFKLKKWSRSACLRGSIVFLAWSWLCAFTPWNPLNLIGLAELSYFISPLYISIPVIFFFTRPKVKEQFK